MKNIEIQLSESARVKELMISSCTQSIQNAADLIIERNISFSFIMET